MRRRDAPDRLPVRPRRSARGRVRRRDRGARGPDGRPRRRGALLRALLRLPLARCRQLVRLEAAQGSSRVASEPTGRTSTCARSSRDDALFAIRNGGFSGAIMPANIVVGEDAEPGGGLPGAVLRRGSGSERPDLLRRVRALARHEVAVLDLREIREDPEPARDALARRGVDPAAARRGARARRATPRRSCPSSRSRGGARTRPRSGSGSCSGPARTRRTRSRRWGASRRARRSWRRSCAGWRSGAPPP